MEGVTLILSVAKNPLNEVPLSPLLGEMSRTQ